MMELKSALLRRHRVANGLCPNDGKEAAPYYLCHECRRKSFLIKVLNYFEKKGFVEKSKSGRTHLWKANSEKIKEWEHADTSDFRITAFDMKPGDKRLAPRMRGVPVDFEKTIIEIFMAEGKPLSIEQVARAWVRLREKRKTSSLAGDMKLIIAAQERREAKNAKRAARAGLQ